MTRNTWRHGELVHRVSMLLGDYQRLHSGWSISVGDPGTKLGTRPDKLRGPDVGIVRPERVPTGHGSEGWLEGAPDLAVEVMGDDQTPAQLAKKALEYLAAGAKQVWLVDGKAESVIVYSPPNHVSVLAKDETLDGGDALPGFACKVAALFT